MTAESKTPFQLAWEELIALGLIVPTGEMRPGKDGKPARRLADPSKYANLVLPDDDAQQ
jgi:hypothetical protein